MDKKEKAIIICRFLRKRYKKHLLDLKNWHDDIFQLLIATILSQRTRDENTERASRQLFNVARTPKAILKLDTNKLQKLIRPSGFFRQKARKIKQVSKIIIERYNGNVPSTREELLALPGVGFKTAAIILCYGYGIPTIPVDTHVNQISKRIGLVKPNADVEDVRQELEKVIPKKDSYIINLGMIQFGKEICKPVKPSCGLCPFIDTCKYALKNGKI
jgi:endonuclease-3